LLAGLLAALVAVFLGEYFDDRIRSRADLEVRTGAPVLAVVPRLGLVWRSRSRKPLLARRESDASAYAFRRLRARLLAGGIATAPSTVLATSVEDDEATAVTVVRLAAAFAKANFRTSILTLDVRHHRVERLLDVRPTFGLADALLDHRPFASIGIPTGLANLMLVPAGSGRAEDTDLFASSHFGDVLEEARQAADIVLVDAPAESTGGDLAVLAGQVDGSILVVKAGFSRYRTLRATVGELRAAGKPVFGIVLADRVPRRGGQHVGRGGAPRRRRVPDGSGSRDVRERVTLGGQEASNEGAR
jgi:succinoglycan biosynthesis transport protein ExoP